VSYRQPVEIRSFAFGEPDGDVAGTMSVWDGGFSSSFGAPARVEGSDPDVDWHLAGEGFELTFAPASEVADLDLPEAGIRSLHQLAHVRGTVLVGGEERAVDCAGQRSRRLGALEGKRFVALRAVSAWFGAEDGLAVLSARPRRARGHDSELVTGLLLEGGVPVPVAEPRLSSTYTADGAPARAGLELWLGEGEEQFARRAAGEAMGQAAVSEDPPLRSELLRMRMRGREGVGVYDLLSAR
jgi:hypothetical protein